MTKKAEAPKHRKDWAAVAEAVGTAKRIGRVWEKHWLPLGEVSLSSVLRSKEAQPHGKVKKYWGGCRCPLCRSAMAGYERDRRKRKRDGYLVSRKRKPAPKHGERRVYGRGCRCGVCKAANARYCRTRYHAMKKAAHPLWRLRRRKG